MLEKIMRIVDRVAIICLAALIASSISMFISTGIDASAEATIGIQKNWGFPVAFRWTAPGLAWAQFDGICFLINTLAWCLIIEAGLLGIRSFRKKMCRDIKQ